MSERHSYGCSCGACEADWRRPATMYDPPLTDRQHAADLVCAAAIDAENLRTAALEAAQAAREPFVGFRCDRIGCAAEINGNTSSPERCRALTTRAESRGWQCLHHDGKPLHFCPEHVEPLLPTRRVLK